MEMFVVLVTVMLSPGTHICQNVSKCDLEECAGVILLLDLNEAVKKKD